jgi:hypothetical protein
LGNLVGAVATAAGAAVTKKMAAIAAAIKYRIRITISFQDKPWCSGAHALLHYGFILLLSANIFTDVYQHIVTY